jgi:small subunit ribosomal protein S17
MKQLIGTIISTKMKQTVVVAVETKWQHPVYKKTVKKTKKFLVHDPFGVKLGDVVSIVETHPISKLKHWLIINPSPAVDTVKTSVAAIEIKAKAQAKAKAKAPAKSKAKTTAKK